MPFGSEKYSGFDPGETLSNIEEHGPQLLHGVASILKSEIYLGHVPQQRGQLVSRANTRRSSRRREWRAAHVGSCEMGPGGRRRALKSGSMWHLWQTHGGRTERTGSTFYRCWNRGARLRSARTEYQGFVRAAGGDIGMSLLGTDPELQEAIRRRMAGGTRRGPRRGAREPPGTLHRWDLARLFGRAQSPTATPLQREDQR